MQIFFLNAIITFGIAIIAIFVLPWGPEREPSLTERERSYIMARNQRLSAGLAKEEATKSSLILRAFTSPTSWFGVFVTCVIGP